MWWSSSEGTPAMDDGETLLCGDWIGLWIDVALVLNMAFSACSFVGGYLLIRNVSKTSVWLATTLRWIALTTMLQTPFQFFGSGHLLFYSSNLEGWSRCDLSTWPQPSFILIFLFELFRTAGNGYVLLVSRIFGAPPSCNCCHDKSTSFPFFAGSSLEDSLSCACTSGQLRSRDHLKAVSRPLS